MLKLEDLVPGGKADNVPKRGVNIYELQMGIKVEMEHTNDPVKSEEIARDHLAEDPNYYSKLKKAGLADELEESQVGDSFIEVGELVEHMDSDIERLTEILAKMGILTGDSKEFKELDNIRTSIVELKDIFKDSYDFDWNK
jgi:hypothetical protein